MAAEPEQAEEPGVSPSAEESPDPVDAVDGGTASVAELDAEAVHQDAGAEEIRPEDVREGIVDLVAYAVGALALVALGYFTQRDVLTWTRGPFTVVCIIMAVHWAGRRIQRATRRRKAEDGLGTTGKAGTTQ